MYNIVLRQVLNIIICDFTIGEISLYITLDKREKSPDCNCSNVNTSAMLFKMSNSRNAILY